MAESAITQQDTVEPPPPIMAAGNTESSNNVLEENFKHSVEDLSYYHHHHHHHLLHYHKHNNPPRSEDVSAFANGITATSVNMANSFNGNMGTHLMQEVIDVLSYDHSNWNPSVHELQDLVHANHHHEQQQQQFQQMESQCFNNSSSILGPSPDLLNLLNPTQKIIPVNFQNSMGFLSELPIGADNSSTSACSVLYDPLFHLNHLPPAPPAPLRELFQSLPRGYSLPTSSRNGGSLFGGGDEMEGNGIVYQDGDGSQLDNNGVLEFNRGTACVAKGREGKGAKPFATEKQRREQLNGKYQVLRSLIPNPTKGDRASVVGDAIKYIRELIRTVNELKLLVENKKYGRDRCKRQKGNEDDGASDQNCDIKPFSDRDGCIRTSWLQRKSKDTEVDVRIIDDEVTIKLVQRKKISCLLFVSKVLDELELDLHHVAGGHVGEYCSFLFNSKIYEGSTIYANAIANKVIEVLDRQYAAATPHANDSY